MEYVIGFVLVVFIIVVLSGGSDNSKYWDK